MQRKSYCRTTLFFPWQYLIYFYDSAMASRHTKVSPPTHLGSTQRRFLFDSVTYLFGLIRSKHPRVRTIVIKYSRNHVSIGRWNFLTRTWLPEYFDSTTLPFFSILPVATFFRSSDGVMFKKLLIIMLDHLQRRGLISTDLQLHYSATKGVISIMRAASCAKSPGNVYCTLTRSRE